VPLAATAFTLGSAADLKGDLVESSELHISTIALLCGLEAERMISEHRARRAPLEPFGEVPVPAQNSSALLGLMVQIRGSDHVRKDLGFSVRIKSRHTEGIYRGGLPARESISTHKTVAVTTDWWIDLERVFASGEITAMCRDRAAVTVEVIDYSFSKLDAEKLRS
jgi:hypothetical protein